MALKILTPFKRKIKPCLQIDKVFFSFFDFKLKMI